MIRRAAAAAAAAADVDDGIKQRKNRRHRLFHGLGIWQQHGQAKGQGVSETNNYNGIYNKLVSELGGCT